MRGASRRTPAAPRSSSRAIEVVQVAQQPCVQQETDKAYTSRRPNHLFVAAKVCVHCCRQQPELQEYEHQHEREHAVDDGGALGPGEWSTISHIRPCAPECLSRKYSRP